MKTNIVTREEAFIILTKVLLEDWQKRLNGGDVAYMKDIIQGGYRGIYNYSDDELETELDDSTPDDEEYLIKQEDL